MFVKNPRIGYSGPELKSQIEISHGDLGTLSSMPPNQNFSCRTYGFCLEYPTHQNWNFSWRAVCWGLVCGNYRCIPRGYRLNAANSTHPLQLVLECRQCYCLCLVPTHTGCCSKSRILQSTVDSIYVTIKFSQIMQFNISKVRSLFLKY